MSEQATAPLHQEMPHSAEAEMGVLGSLLKAGGELIEQVRPQLSPEAFYVPSHKTLYVVLGILYENKSAVDFITVTQVLKDEGHLEAMGGPSFISDLFIFVPTAANIDYYVQIVRDKYLLRQIIQTCTTSARRAYQEQTDVEGTLADLQSNVIEIGQLSSTVEALQPIGASIPEVVAGIEATYHSRGKPTGLPTGFVDLDRRTGGLHGGRTYYIGARPAMGKSSIGTEFAEHVAIDNAERQVPVAIFSVEMTTHELAEVILCRRANVNLIRLRDGFFSDEQQATLKAEAEKLKSARIYIDDKADLSIFELRARGRRAVSLFGVKLIIIDFIQRLKSTSKRAQGNREQEINEIAQGISQMAKELNVPIVVLAQLSRKSEERADKVPELADFRESGSLEQEAHFVGLLHRPIYYCKSPEKAQLMAEKYGMDIADFERYAELIIAKQRRGPVGTVKLKFIKEIAAFHSEDDARPLYSNNETLREQRAAAPTSAGSAEMSIEEADRELDL